MSTKVLFLIESLSGGGAEKVLYTLLKNIDKEKLDVTLCVVNDLGVYRDEISKLVKYKPLIKRQTVGRIKWWHRFKYLVNFKMVYSWLPLSWVYNLGVPKGNDVEVAFVEGYCTKLLSHSTNSRARKYAWVHIDLENNHWIKDVYTSLESEKRSYQKYNVVVGVSNIVEKVVAKLYNLENTRTLHNPIDSDEIIRLSSVPIEKEYQEHKRLRICSVGRFVEQKRFDRLLRIMHRLGTEGIDAELWLIGIGPLYGKYVNFIKENGLDDKVRLLGFKSNPYPYMKACDLFVCSSKAEGYSTAMTEACILGLPMVTTDCSGMDEILDGGRYGVIASNDCDSLYNAVKELLTNPEKLEDYRVRSQARSAAFSLNSLMKPIEDFLLK